MRRLKARPPRVVENRPAHRIGSGDLDRRAIDWIAAGIDDAAGKDAGANQHHERLGRRWVREGDRSSGNEAVRPHAQGRRARGNGPQPGATPGVRCRFQRERGDPTLGKSDACVGDRIGVVRFTVCDAHPHVMALCEAQDRSDLLAAPDGDGRLDRRNRVAATRPEGVGPRLEPADADVPVSIGLRRSSRPERGPGHHDLCMSRIAPVGPHDVNGDGAQLSQHERHDVSVVLGAAYRIVEARSVRRHMPGALAKPSDLDAAVGRGESADGQGIGSRENLDRCAGNGRGKLVAHDDLERVSRRQVDHHAPHLRAERNVSRPAGVPRGIHQNPELAARQIPESNPAGRGRLAFTRGVNAIVDDGQRGHLRLRDRGSLRAVADEDLHGAISIVHGQRDAERDRRGHRSKP